MVNIFIHHRDLRIFDNTTLIKMNKELENVTSIFIFPPEQINKKKNKYFSDNSVQFMIESLIELNDIYKKYNSQLYFFKGDIEKILNSINKENKIENIGFNFDYSPYAIKRDKNIKKFCEKNKIKTFIEEDYPLFPFTNKETFSGSDKPYTVFTPFKNNLIKKYKVKKPDKFKKFNFKNIKLNSNKFLISNIKDLHKFYNYNKDINVKGGRGKALIILKNIKNWDKYNDKRNCMDYKTTFLSAYLHFTCVSIREVYHKILKKLGDDNDLITELIWRDFYMNISYFFPKLLDGMINKNNKSFREEYDKIPWNKDNKTFKKWCEGRTGYPIVDACMTQMNKTGYMHNRGRMIVASFLTKHLLIDWRKGEQYFASKLVDYDCHSNNGGWQWSSGSGTDAQPYFRIFNPWTQAKKFDPNCVYIIKWLPVFKNVEIKDIIKWDDKKIRDKYDIDYPEPIVDHKTAREKTLKVYKKNL